MKCLTGLVRPGKCALWPATTWQRRPLTNASAIAEELQSRQLPIIVDDMSVTPFEVLNASLEDFLAPVPTTAVDKALSDLLAHDEKAKDEQQQTETEPSGVHRLDRFRTRYTNKHMYPGYHLVYFHPQTRQSDLLDDGTDIIHAPDRSWKYRFWMGGTIQFSTAPKLSGNSKRLALVQRISQAKVRDSKILVQVERAVLPADKPKSGLKDNTTPEQPEEQGLRLRDLAFPDSAAIRSTSTESDPTGTPYVREFRWLYFMKDKPDISSQRKIPPPSVDVLERHTMTPTPALLFRFSALTANAHAIHLDAEYSKKEYGLRERLVQGPLTLFLMLTIARRALNRSRDNNRGISYSISSIDYKNLAPLYVNEPLTIVCGQIQQPPEASNPDDSAAPTPATMEIWIQRSHDDASGDASVCVKATATLSRRDPKVAQKKAEVRALFREAARTGATLSKGELKKDPGKLVRKTVGSLTWTKEMKVASDDDDAVVRKVWEHGDEPLDEKELRRLRWVYRTRVKEAENRAGLEGGEEGQQAVDSQSKDEGDVGQEASARPEGSQP